MANHQSLPQHGKPSPTLSLMLKEFTEKNLRRHHQSLPQHGKPSPTLSLMLKEFTEKNLRRPSVLVPWVSLVQPLYIPYLSLIHALCLLGYSGGATAPPLGRRGRLARDNHGGLVWIRSAPAIHLLPGPDKDARTRRKVAEFPEVHLGDVAGASVRSRQQTEEAEVPADPSARGARGRPEDQGMPGGHLEHAEQEGEPVQAVADHQRPQRVHIKRRSLGRVQIRGQADERLVRVDLRKKVLPGETATLGPATTPFLLLGGHLPGAPLVLR